MPKKTKENNLHFSDKLVLNSYLINQIGFNNFEDLSKVLKDTNEGNNENQISHFYNALISSSGFSNSKISADMLLEYDMNITRHTNKMQGKRENPIKWKYFQYLCLLFVEIYLDRYFTEKTVFLEDLNRYKNSFDNFVDFSDYTLEDLNKIAIWNSTGSGKTLLMHMNILQYRYYLEKHNKTKELNKILLITPNEGLSRQHLENFGISKIDAEIFDKKGETLFSANKVEIIEIQKLKEEGKEKTISVDSFENNNLVLVDEVHKGTQGNEWKEKRDRLSTEGFAFEYSATLGQAVKASKNKNLEEEYGKTTIFDYSYKWFYGDGYGKDYRIMNLEKDFPENTRKLYLTGCLLAFYQQLLVWNENKKTIKPFNIEKPLWIFVGGTVTAVRNQSGKKVSDVLDILLFLSDFIRNKEQSIEALKRLTSGKTGLLDPEGRDVFSNTFSFVNGGRLFGEALYQDILEKIFNTNVQGLIHVEDLKGASGEISLRISENEPFGLINVGDSSELIKLCQNYSNELVVSDKNFNRSMFDTIKSEKSTLNVLIGSKKFTEGWDCYRVSTMGLMNIGRSEGSEIIQLFGRGVRLMGYENCLKRSSAINASLTKEMAHAVRCLETLNIFGVRADYMKQFQEYLENEGLPSGGNRKEEFILPVIQNIPLKKLKVIKVKDGLDFKKQGDKPRLEYHSYLSKNPVLLDWYPKIQAIKSKKADGGNTVSIKEENKITPELLTFIDWTKLYLDLEDYKAEKACFNLNLDIEGIKNIFTKNDWYRLFIPSEELFITDYTVFERIYNIVQVLLRKYIDKFYAFKKSDWEKDKLVYEELTASDSNFFDEYKIYVSESERDLISKIEQLTELIKGKHLKDFSFIPGKSICFDRHLYNPILSLSHNEIIEIKPVALNEGETKFVEDLKNYCSKEPQNELYLLRNRSKGSGMGFFEEGGFYPDFILWQIKEDKQYITFIDPKGIYNLEGGIDNPKIRLAQRIKLIEKQLGNPNIILNSAIVSVTSYNNIIWRGNSTEEDFERNHVFFQQKETYIQKIIEIK